jgi:oligopeptide transport system substrate-binding protein
VWASFFESLPPADFAIQNGTDVKTLDPARATGNVEGRLLNALFEGLLRMMPAGPPDPETGVQPMSPQPAMAESFDVSDDGTTYTFHLREGVTWTNGDRVTAEDFAWSWQRMLHPETACEYVLHLYHLPYAEQYNSGVVAVGDKVEVELWDRPGETPEGESNGQPFPRGTVRYGVLEEIAEAELSEEETAGLDDSQIAALQDERRRFRVKIVEEQADGTIDWEAEGSSQWFAQNTQGDPEVTRVHHVLVAFGKLGTLETPDPQTFVVHLQNATPYFPNVVAFYPLYPVNRQCVEAHGSPMWTKADNIVTNGPYRLEFRRLRDRLRVRKNSDYWNASETHLETVDFMSVTGQTTALNMYETGQLHWVTDPPSSLLEYLRDRPDFVRAPQLSVYFYRLNVDVWPLDDPRVRRALAMSIDRQVIVDEVTKAYQLPAFTFVPPGLTGYENADPFPFDPIEAKRLLAEAGFEDGRGFPELTILYNTQETHRAIAEVIQQQWRNNLNVVVGLQNMEWGTFLDKYAAMEYQVARAGWIADYPDPNTFLDMWVTDGAQNSTGWSNSRYDQLIEDAGREGDPEARMKLLQEAEQVLLDEMPVIPIYHYTSLNMVKPNVRGFSATAQDIHPLHILRFADEEDSEPPPEPTAAAVPTPGRKEAR